MLKRIARGVLGAPVIYPRLRRKALRGNPATILCYHTLGADHETMDAWTVLRMSDFRDHVEFLAEHYDIVTLDAALEPSDRPRAVLTFDDGDVGLFNHLLPFIEAWKLPVTIYIATGQIETGQPYWFDRVMNALQATGPFEIDLTELGLRVWKFRRATGPARWTVISDILETFKRLPPTQREIATEALVAQSPASDRRFTRLTPLTVEQLKQLAACPYVTIGAHSHCHSLLDQILPKEAEESAARSRNLLQGWTAQPVRHFAYPNGNHNAALREIMAGLGFTSSTVLDNELARPGANPHALSRLAIGRYDDLARFRLRVAGL